MRVARTRDVGSGFSGEQEAVVGEGLHGLLERTVKGENPADLMEFTCSERSTST